MFREEFLMKRNKRMLLAAVSMAVFMTACGGSEAEAPKAPAKDLNEMTMDELIAAAKEEGTIETVGMPDNWAHWGDSFARIKELYGIERYDTDMGSAEELAIFEAEKDDPTKDLGDVGHAFSVVATEKDVVQGFKPSTWDSIPDWAKDPDGKWIMSYTGTLGFCVNTDLTGGIVPRTWAELLEGDYKVCPGNVVGGASAQIGVISCAIANGGSLDNVQPGIDFYKKLAEQGRIDPGENNYSRIANGEVAVSTDLFDFVTLGYQDTLEQEGSNVKIQTVIPQDGAITSGYCLVFNKYSPHPHATALAIEYLLSDEGQIDRAKGFARPIREDVEIPAEIEAKMLPDSEYENTVKISDVNELTEACEKVAKLWEEEVIPLFN